MYEDEDEDDEPKTSIVLPVVIVVALGLGLGALYALLTPADEPLDVPSAPAPSAPSPSEPDPSQPAPSETPLVLGSPPASAETKSASIEDFLAEPAPSSEPSASGGADSLELRGVEDLRPLGGLAPYVWQARGPSWIVSKRGDRFIGIESVPANPVGVSIRYFELTRTEPGQSLSARVTTRVEADQEKVSGGLIYGRTDRRDYYLIGISNLGTRFIRHRTREGLQDRVSGTLPSGPHTFGIKEEGSRLSVYVDGRMLMGLGGAADPEARVGVFVVGRGRAEFRDFEYELR